MRASRGLTTLLDRQPAARLDVQWRAVARLISSRTSSAGCFTTSRCALIHARRLYTLLLRSAFVAVCVGVATSTGFSQPPQHTPPLIPPQTGSERGDVFPSVRDTLSSRTIASTTALLDSLLTRAREMSPQLRAAQARVTAARRQIAPAGLRPDPMLMAGIQNLPVREPGFSDFMTMKMVGISQTLPYPGKLGLQRRVAERESDGTAATLTDVTRQVLYDVRAAYYELAFLDRALEIVQRNQDVLGTLIHLTETRYSVGSTGQSDVLKARVEAARLAETAVMLTTQRRVTVARLNAMLDRPSETPIAHPTLPAAILHAAVADSASQIRFLAPALGALAADSPLPSLDSLQALALRGSAALHAHETMIAAQRARVDLARKAGLPDIGVSLQYGQRQAQPDMVTAVVSIPFPVHKRRNQDALTASADATRAALDAEHVAMQNDIRAEVARLHNEAERQRTQLALSVKAILPQSRAALASATASYQVGRVDLLTVLDHQATVFTTETDYYRVLTDFATTVAQLERITGTELLP